MDEDYGNVANRDEELLNLDWENDNKQDSEGFSLGFDSDYAFELDHEDTVDILYSLEGNVIFDYGFLTIFGGEVEASELGKYIDQVYTESTLVPRKVNALLNRSFSQEESIETEDGERFVDPRMVEAGSSQLNVSENNNNYWFEITQELEGFEVETAMGTSSSYGELRIGFEAEEDYISHLMSNDVSSELQSFMESELGLEVTEQVQESDSGEKASDHNFWEKAGESYQRAVCRGKSGTQNLKQSIGEGYTRGKDSILGDIYTEESSQESDRETSDGFGWEERDYTELNRTDPVFGIGDEVESSPEFEEYLDREDE